MVLVVVAVAAAAAAAACGVLVPVGSALYATSLGRLFCLIPRFRSRESTQLLSIYPKPAPLHGSVMCG